MVRPQLRSITLTLALPVALGLFQASVCAQEARRDGKEHETIWLEFKGGTLADYAAAVKKAAGGDLNVVVDGQAESVEMPPVTLKNVTVGTAFKLIRSSVDGAVAVADLQTIREGQAGEEVYVLRVILARRKTSTEPLPAAPAKEPKRLQVFPLKRLLQDSGQEANTDSTVAVLKALDVALDLDAPDSKDKPVVKYHSESGLMMVRGTDEQLTVVSQILTNLSLQVPPGSAPAAFDDEGARLLLKEIKDLKDEVEKLKAEIAKLKASAAKVEDKQETKP